MGGSWRGESGGWGSCGRNPREATAKRRDGFEILLRGAVLVGGWVGAAFYLPTCTTRESYFDEAASKRKHMEERHVHLSPHELLEPMKSDCRCRKKGTFRNTRKNHGRRATWDAARLLPPHVFWFEVRFQHRFEGVAHGVSSPPVRGTI